MIAFSRPSTFVGHAVEQLNGPDTGEILEARAHEDSLLPDVVCVMVRPDNTTYIWRGQLTKGVILRQYREVSDE